MDQAKRTRSRIINFRKGNGMAITGFAVLVLAAVLCSFLMEFFARNEQKNSLQNAADTLADSTANYALKHKVEFDDVKEYAETLKEDITRILGIRIDRMDIDKRSFVDHNIVKITLYQGYTGGKFLGRNGYQIEVTAATEFHKKTPQQAADG